jgi:hypothetical protein
MGDKRWKDRDFENGKQVLVMKQPNVRLMIEHNLFEGLFAAFTNAQNALKEALTVYFEKPIALSCLPGPLKTTSSLTSPKPSC